MLKATLCSIFIGATVGVVIKFVSSFVLEWAISKFPQEQVIDWTSYAIAIIISISVAGKAYDVFTSKEEENDDDDEEED